MKGMGAFFLGTLSSAVFLAADEPHIDRVEYFVGEDPGLGQATEVPVEGEKSAADLALTLPPDNFPKRTATQVTVRARDSDGNWGPPMKLPVGPSLTSDDRATVTGVEAFLPDGSSSEAAIPLSIAEEDSAAEAELVFPVNRLDFHDLASGWARAKIDGSAYGFPTVFRVKTPVDRFAGNEVTGVGGWHYLILDGATTVEAGTATETADETLGGFDLRSLDPDREYSLIIIPMEQTETVPLHVVATELETIRDYELWRRTHFSEADQLNDEVSGPSADPGGTGMTNFERFVAGLAPDDPAEGLRGDIVVTSDEEGLIPTLRFERSRLARSTTLALESSETLDEWMELSLESIESTDTEASLELLNIVPELSEETSPGRMFFRIRVTPGEAYK